MEDIMTEIMSLCVKYNQMFMTERAVRNCEDDTNYEMLSKAYELDKENFDNQYSKVENLIKKL